MLNRCTKKIANPGIFSRVHSKAKSLEYTLGTESRTRLQNEAGAKNLATWRASHAWSPRLRSGVHGFLKSGKVPSGVSGGTEIAAHVEELLDQMIRERSVKKCELSAAQWGVLNDQRRCLVALGLIDIFLYRGGSIGPDDERLLTNLHNRARRNFCKFQKGNHIDAMLASFASCVYEIANERGSREPTATAQAASRGK